MLLVIDPEGQVSNFRVLLSALFLLIGILAKTTAIFGLPMIISVIWLQKQTISDKIRQSSIILSVFLFICLIGGWFFFTSSNYSLEDFSNSTILTKFHTNPLSLLIAPLRIFWRACQVFPILFPLSLFSSLILIKNTQYRFNPLTLSAISWIGAAFLILSSSDYSPPRYMIVFCIPIAIIVPLITDFIFNTAQKKTTQKVVIGVLLLSLVINAFKLGNYFSSLSRSFVVMAEDVATQIEQQGGHSDILMGHFADTVSLVNNIKSINDQIGYRSLDYRIQKFDPGYYISLGAIEPEIKTNLSKYYDVQLLKTYEVYNNSHQNKPVILYQLRPF